MGKSTVTLAVPTTEDGKKQSSMGVRTKGTGFLSQVMKSFKIDCVNSFKLW